MISRSAVRNSLLVMASLSLALVAAELMLRVVGLQTTNFYVRDPYTGGWLRPGAQGWFTNEGRAFVRINNMGLRADRDTTIAKPSGALRVAVLGDSYMEAMQVSAEEALPGLLARQSPECSTVRGREVEVLNFGVSGFGTAQALLALRHRAWAFDPDVVVLAFLPANDITDNSRPLNGSSDRPFFTLNGDVLVADMSFAQADEFKRKSSHLHSVIRFFSDRSQVWQLIRKIRVGWATAAEVKRRRVGAGGVGTLGFDDRVFQEPRSKEWREAWQVTEALILAINEEVRARGKQFVLVGLSSGIDVHPDVGVRRAYMDALGVDNLDYPSERLAALAGRNGIRHVGLTAPFRAHAESTGEYLHGFGSGIGKGHWNQRGHSLAAALVSPALCEALGSVR